MVLVVPVAHAMLHVLAVVISLCPDYAPQSPPSPPDPRAQRAWRSANCSWRGSRSRTERLPPCKQRRHANVARPVPVAPHSDRPRHPGTGGQYNRFHDRLLQEQVVVEDGSRSSDVLLLTSTILTDTPVLLRKHLLGARDAGRGCVR